MTAGLSCISAENTKKMQPMDRIDYFCDSLLMKENISLLTRMTHPGSELTWTH